MEVYCVRRGYSLRAFDFTSDIKVEFKETWPILIAAQAKGEEVMERALEEFTD